MTNAPLAIGRGKLDLHLLVAGSAALSISTLFSAMKPVLISRLVEQAGYSAAIAGLAAAMPFLGGAIASLLLARLARLLSVGWSLRALCLGLPLLEIGNAIWFSVPAALLLGQFAAGLCGGLMLGLTSRLVARSDRSEETFGLADMAGVLLMSLMLPAVGEAVARIGLRGGFLVAAVFSALFAMGLHLALQGLSREADTTFAGERRLARNRIGWRAVAVIATGVCFVTFSGLGFAFMVTIARGLGLGYDEAGSAIGVILLFSASGCFVGGWCAARFGPKFPLLAAFTLCAVGWHIALNAQTLTVFLAALVPAIFALQFCFPVLLSLAGSLDPEGRTAAIAAPLIVSGFAFAAVLAGFLVDRWGVGALPLATSAGMVLCAALLLAGTSRSSSEAGAAMQPYQ